MKIAGRVEKAFHYLLPSPFTLAVLLTLLTVLLAMIFGQVEEGFSGFRQLMLDWEKGLWNASLLVFMLQMMLILVLGHSLALAPAVDKIIQKIISYANSPAKAAFLVAFSTMLTGYLNWGLGLIFGAVLARKTAEKFSENRQKLNYPLIGAAGYAALMVWHGGLSGSAPVKVVEAGHLSNLMEGIFNSEQLARLPQSISLNDTVFSPMNIFSAITVLLIVPLILAVFAKKSSHKVPNVHQHEPVKPHQSVRVAGAERLDHSRIFAGSFAVAMLLLAIYIASTRNHFFTPNYINFLLLSLGMLLHGSLHKYSLAVGKAISGASGILIQFPLYFGVMALMKSSGLISEISDFFISVSDERSFPIFTFFSAGLVNIFVPSGGGQWAVQGPIIIEAASQLNISLSKGIMALAYGDQLTNMLQPFWALPLLGITGLKAREILPYTLMMMCVGGIIYITALLIF